MESVLLIEIPEAEPAVREHRLRFDPVSTRGIPAHITALFPFVPPADLATEAVGLVAQVVVRHPPFAYRFSATRRFDDAVLYLAPDDPGPFVRLIEDLVSAFPDHPPYGGAYPEIVPHLTVARSDDPAELRAVDQTLLRHLPVEGHVQRLTLMIGSDDTTWARSHTFSLTG